MLSHRELRCAVHRCTSLANTTSCTGMAVTNSIAVSHSALVVNAGAEGCTLQLASHQIRIHNAHRSKMYIRARSNPIIEHSDELQFAPYCPAYPGSDEQLRAAGLHEDNGLWQEVQDFGWLKHSQSPNWYAVITLDAAAVVSLNEISLQRHVIRHASGVLRPCSC